MAQQMDHWKRGARGLLSGCEELRQRIWRLSSLVEINLDLQRRRNSLRRMVRLVPTSATVVLHHKQVNFAY